MPFSKLTDRIDELRENIQAYVESMLEYYKLDLFKKITKGSSLLVKMLVFGSIFLFFLGFISMAVAFLIGDALESLSSGFFIVGGFYFIVFILFLLYGKNLVDKFFLRIFSELMFNEKSFEEAIESFTDTEDKKE